MYDIMNNKILPQVPLPSRREFLDITDCAVILDSKNNIYLLIEGASRLLYLFFYDQDKGEWKTNVLKIEKRTSDLRIFLWGENIYVGAESYKYDDKYSEIYDRVFIVIKCNLADLKEGVIFDAKE